MEHEIMFELSEQEKRDIRALDGQIKKLAAKVWDKHPNNPKNKR